MQLLVGPKCRYGFQTESSSLRVCLITGELFDRTDILAVQNDGVASNRGAPVHSSMLYYTICRACLMLKTVADCISRGRCNKGNGNPSTFCWARADQVFLIAVTVGDTARSRSCIERSAQPKGFVQSIESS